MRSRGLLVVLLTGLLVNHSQAQSVSERLQNLRGLAASSQQQFLHPDEAFIISATVQDPAIINVQWQIADGYYLYRDKYTFDILEGDTGIDNDAMVIPAGTLKEDPSFGSVEINTGDVIVDVPLLRRDPGQVSVSLQVGYQGCKDNSLCYPPIKKVIPLILPPVGATAGPGTAIPATTLPVAGMVSEQDSYTMRLIQDSVLLNMVIFFGAGLLLSLTPCVFPMIPILSGILVGQKTALNAGRGLVLSLTYVLAMAFTYAIIGVMAAMAGVNIQAAAQNIWVISLFSLVFVGLALSMFGFYEIRMPASLQDKLIRYSNSQTGGTLSGVAIMGAVSAVIVGPCVVPPLIGALAYITQTGDEVMGGAALFAMGLGMGVPLLAIGASAGSWLPKAGRWMETVKHVFGVGLLGLAIWFMARVIPPAVELYLWAVLLIASAIYMGALDQVRETGWGRLWKALGLVMLVYGILLIVGASSGSSSLYQPLQGITTAGRVEHVTERLAFRRIKTAAELDAELAAASSAGKPVMLDFYADWCIECIRMESTTFPRPEVRAALREVVLLQADVTRNDEEDRELLARFGIYGPPAILFFDRQGQERQPYRLYGFVGAEKFTAHVRDATSSGI